MHPGGLSYGCAVTTQFDPDKEVEKLGQVRHLEIAGEADQLVDKTLPCLAHGPLLSLLAGEKL